MKKKKPPEPDVIVLENHIEPDWSFRVNLTEADVRRLNDGTVPDWLQKTAAFWCRDNPKPSDVPTLEPLPTVDAVARDVA